MIDRTMPESLKKLLRPFYVPIANLHYRLFKAPRRYHHLYDTIKAIKAKHILEIGVWNGKRAMKMLEIACRESDQVSYYGYDLFEDLGEAGYTDEFSKMPPTRAAVEALLKETGATVQLFMGNTKTTLPESLPNLPKMDFIFIDGGHSIETIESDWQNVERLMHDTTVVIFDDYWRNRTDAGCKPVVDTIDTTQYRVEILPEIDSFDNPDFGRLDISFARVTKTATSQ